MEDLLWRDEGAVLTLRRSKTDLEGQGGQVAIPRGAHPATCPVTALRLWIEAAGLETGPLFREVDRHGRVGGARLHSNSVGAILKRAVARAGFDPRGFGGHSLRAGFTTWAARNGATAFDIMRQTGHRSVATVSRYVRDAQIFRDAPAGCKKTPKNSGASLVTLDVYTDSLLGSSTVGTLKVCYATQSYTSHKRAGDAYRSLLSNTCLLTNSIQEADVVVLHYEPQWIETIYSRHPELSQKYVVGYCVWEASILPHIHVQGISYLQEIWTPSHYCCEIFSRYHHNVYRVPHIVGWHDSLQITETLRTIPITNDIVSLPYAFAISRMSDARKNCSLLLDAFAIARSELPEMKLLLKLPPNEYESTTQSDGVVYLPQHLSADSLATLYKTAAFYVSPHHAEGWGLTLSDAMLFNCLTVATDYSGNCDFMNPHTSIMIPPNISCIREEDCSGFFTSEMQWANPQIEDVTSALLQAWEAASSGSSSVQVANARSAIADYSAETVSQLIEQHITRLTFTLS